LWRQPGRRGGGCPAFLAGDIEDEDSTLFDRQEQRAGRFSDYSDRRAVESEQALAHVDSLASAVPLGQPILVATTASAARAGMRRKLRTA
jgi:hypothetical protein